jgi:hypothetical protein
VKESCDNHAGRTNVVKDEPVFRGHASQLIALPPVAGGNEGGPVERMGALAAGPAGLQHGEARVTEGICGAQALLEPAVLQRTHPHARGAIVHGPEAHDHVTRAGDLERATQTEHALSGFDFAEPGRAGRQHRSFGALQVQGRDFLGGHDAVIFFRTCGRPPVGAGHRQAGKKKGILRQG